MTRAPWRWGRKVHTQRPAARERAARWAWDILQGRGPITDMKLIDGLWMCQRPNGDLDHVDAATARYFTRRP